MKKCISNSGYSLVEVLVSISILMIAIIGPITIAVSSIKSASYALEQNTAYFLAQEGIESLLSLRDRLALQEIDGTLPTLNSGWFFFRNYINTVGPCDFTTTNICKFGISIDPISTNPNFTANECLNGSADTNCLLYKDVNDAPFVYSHDSSGSPTKYTRIITVYDYPFRMFIQSEVLWQSNVFKGVEQSIKINTTIYNLI